MSAAAAGCSFPSVLPSLLVGFNEKNPRHLLHLLQKAFKVILAVRMLALIPDEATDPENNQLIQLYDVPASHIRTFDDSSLSEQAKAIEKNILTACLVTAEMIRVTALYLKRIEKELSVEEDYIKTASDIPEVVRNQTLVKATTQTVESMKATAKSVEEIAQTLFAEFVEFYTRRGLAGDRKAFLSDILTGYNSSDEAGSSMQMILGIVTHRTELDLRIATLPLPETPAAFKEGLLKQLVHCKMLLNFVVHGPIKIATAFASAMQKIENNSGKYIALSDKLISLSQLSETIKSGAVAVIDSALPANLRTITWSDFFGDDE